MIPAPDVTTLRTTAVMVPVVGAAVLWWAVPDVRRRGAAVLALIWNLLGLTVCNAIAVSLGWWSFGTSGGELFGLPMDLLLAWAVLWSVIPVLAARWAPPIYGVIGLIVLDVLAMPMLTPAVRLAPQWWIGEVLVVLGCLIPGVVLAEATIRERWLRLRASMQVVAFATLLVVAIPAVALAWSGRSWADVRALIGAPFGIVVVQIAGVVALIALAAVIEFARHGGTPFPWDPPAKLVTTGPYAYIANPMQWCGTAILLLIAMMLRVPALAGAAVIAAAFSAGLAAYVENDSLTTRFCSEWSEYRRSVRNWWPRWRPLVPVRAVVYLARECDPCSELAAWIVARRPVGLDVRPAEDHREPLRRMRYESSSMTVDGVRAFAATLGHLNLAWATVGWVIATPGVVHVVQVLVDACGGAPRDVAGDRAAG